MPSADALHSAVPYSLHTLYLHTHTEVCLCACLSDGVSNWSVSNIKIKEFLQSHSEG